MYKTYSFVYSKEEIRSLLENRGYTIKTLGRIISMIPSLDENKRNIFNAANSTYSSPPSLIYRTKFAWKTEQELLDIKIAIEGLVEKWKKDKFYRTYRNMPMCFLNSRLDKSGKKHLMESVFGRLLKEQINKI